MQTGRIASVFALLALSAHPVAADDWNSLGSVSKLRTFTVHLKNGQKMKGTIQQVDPESLQFAPGKKRISVSVKELAGVVDKAQVGQSVELTTRSGQSLKGTLQEVNSYYIYLDETQNAVRIPRNDIQRITWRSRKMGALLGLGVGAAAGTAVGSSVNLFHDTGVTRAQSAGAGAYLFGLLGAAAGAIGGVERTLYEMPAKAAGNAK